MILKDTLREIIKSQQQELLLLEEGVKREKLGLIDLSLPYAVILSGIRRCGKSTLLRQLMKKTGKCYFINFEDPRLVDFEVSDFQKLKEAFKEEYGDRNCYFFDEIQNIQKWELFVRSLLDKKIKVVITGSNASLLSRELGTRLTGRHVRHELFPFSFKEMLIFFNKKANINSFEEYLKKGGFPEYLKYLKAEILHELLNDVIERDIIVRHKLRESKVIKEMAVYLLTNIGKEFSYNSLKKIFDLGSTNSVIAFISYFENSYLLFTVPKFAYSLKRQLINPKKVYSIDNGLSNVNSVSFSSDRGRMLENIVFLHLRRKYNEIFYFKEKNECDFAVKEKDAIIKSIQVCYELTEDNKQREIDGLIEAIEMFKLKEGLILTYKQEDEFKVNNKKITVKPVWKWLLEG
ncbi:ATP-binding protein [Candidatus Woesearchaeota archaeon]|nr:ATP-binding protein [Candidatus Woesearchaeota archaeon]